MAGDMEQLLSFLILHHVLLDSWWCESCGELCRKDLSRFTFRCDRCHVSRDRRRRRQAWRCRYYRSMFTGTWFARSHLSVSQVCQFTCLWLNLPYPRQFMISREIAVSAHTVVDWSSFCREVCIFWLQKHCTVLGGPGVVVEIDEAKFGKRKYNRGRWLDGNGFLAVLSVVQKIVSWFQCRAADHMFYWIFLNNGFVQGLLLCQIAGKRTTVFLPKASYTKV